MNIELIVYLASSVASGLGIWFWTQHHDHPNLVPQGELSLLRSLIEAQHASVLRELELLRESLNRQSRR